MVYIVALTGGIGSGKSTVSNMFVKLGVTVIDADSIARKITEPTTPISRIIFDNFGANIMNVDGTLNRRLLREKIFSSPSEKQWLDDLLHPLINQEIQFQIENVTFPYVLLEIPLLIENKLYKKVDRVLVVDTTPEKQIQRAVTRDNVSPEHVKKILSTQVAREDRLSIADDIIFNNGRLDAIISNVIGLHEKYLILSSKLSSHLKK